MLLSSLVHVTDFFDDLKSATKGYASMEYQMTKFRKNDLVKLDMKINGEDVDALACIVHRDDAFPVGATVVEALLEAPRER